MRFALAGTVQRNADIQLVDKPADRLRLHEPYAKAENVNQIVTADVREFPRGLPHARIANEYGNKREQFEVRKPALFKTPVNPRLPRIVTRRETGKAIRPAERNLVTQARIFVKVQKPSQHRREPVVRVEDVFAL